MIGEDYNDCTFYKYVLSWYKRYEGHNIKCDFHDEPGGGDRMEVKVAEFAHHYKPALHWLILMINMRDKYIQKKQQGKM